MILIGNQEGTNHSKQIQELFSQADMVWIASPFLWNDYSSFLDDCILDALKEVRLVVNFGKKDSDFCHTINGIFSLKTCLQARTNATLRVLEDKHLHGKVYLFQNAKNNNQKSAIITSANFTGNGLCKNHEWGVLTEDAGTINTLKRKVFDGFPELAWTELAEKKKKADAYSSTHPKQNDSSDLCISSVTSSPSLGEIELQEDIKNHTVWMKPYGDQENPVRADFQIHDDTQPRFNASGKPSAGIGDYFFVYAVGHVKLITLYRITAPAEKDDGSLSDHAPWKARYPYFCKAEEVTPGFSDNWYENDISTRDAKSVAEFLKIHPAGIVTEAGGTSLSDVFKVHNDRVRLTHEFASFLLHKMFEKGNLC